MAVYNRMNFLSKKEQQACLDGCQTTRCELIFKMFGAEVTPNESGKVSCLSAAWGEQLKISEIDISAQDFNQVCEQLESAITSAVQADLKAAIGDLLPALQGHPICPEILAKISGHLGSSSLVVLGLIFTEKLEAGDKDWIDGLLKQLVAVVLTDLDALTRKKIHSLITVAVYYKAQISCDSENPWFQHLKLKLEGDKVMIHRGSDKFEYGCSFNNFQRLVVTPLSVKAWNYDCNAINAKMAGCFCGPAGTGKTETVKDFASILGRNTVVINCSDQMTAEDIAQCVSGLDENDFLCFDEFNRIEASVLDKLPQVFEDNRGKKIFATLNPGYAGRTQLPDALKSKFYNCEENDEDKAVPGMAMMVPDFALIAEVMLYCHGVSSASQLSKTLTKLFTDFKTKLSKNSSYDFGMRAFKHFVVAMGMAKKERQEVDENVLFLNTLKVHYYPRFTKADLEVASKLVKEAFPGVESDLTVEGDEQQFYLRELLKCRHAAAILAEKPGFAEEFLKAEKADYEVVTLKTCEEAYGEMKDGDYKDGTLVTAFKKMMKSEAKLAAVVIRLAEGVFPPVILEAMNMVMDDNKTLLLVNGERLVMTPNMRIILEHQNCDEMSPATVSRMGIMLVQ